MQIAPDTNVLARMIVEDDLEQAAAARVAFDSASLVFISVHTLCELVWLLRSAYKYTREDIAAAIKKVLAHDHVVFDQEPVQAGLDFLDAGGDFADGAIAYEGRKSGGNTFVSFDRKAVAILQSQGHSAQLLD